MILLLAIEDTPDSRLPRAYVPEIFRRKCDALFLHDYEKYPERNVGVCA